MLFDLDQLSNALKRDGTAGVDLMDVGGPDQHDLARKVLISAAHQAGIPESDLLFQNGKEQVVARIHSEGDSVSIAKKLDRT